MMETAQIHIVDTDSRRRAQIAHGLSRNLFRTQVYENVRELETFNPQSGIILINRDDDGAQVEELGVAFERGTYVPFAVYSRSPQTAEVVDAMLAGALDYLSWPFEASDVEGALARISARGAGTTGVERKRALARLAVASLSMREKQVLRSMIKGYSNKETGKSLGISSRTVEIHRANLMKKLAVKTSAEAVGAGLYAGLDSVLELPEI